MRRRLDAAEIADAAVSAALVVALLTVGRLLASGSFFQVIGTAVIAVLAARRRARVVAAATMAAMAMAALLGGIGPISQAFVAGLFGWAGGIGLRRRLGLWRHVAVSVAVGWPVVAAATVAFLWVFDEARDLSLENGRNQWLGFARILRSAGLDTIASGGTRAVDWSIDHWWISVPALQIVVAVVYALIVRRLGRAVLARLDKAIGPPWSPPPATGHELGPLPLTVGPTVTVERGSGATTVVAAETTVTAGETLALLGDNGVGKTTLLEAIAGLHPSTGVATAAAAGLGLTGGTALIGQAPETQVLGLRVSDDIRWGAPNLSPAEISAILEDVGLGGYEDRATEHLSGGELQRLAIAAAMARHPALVLSDESTAMLDNAGRRQVLDLLEAMARTGSAVVHSTHLADEWTRFDRRVDLGRVDADAPTWASAPALFRKVVLRVDDVGYVHDVGSPWAARALRNVSFELERGELMIVQGPNGSGKTTLMRLLAGLITPTEGSITVDGQPLDGPSADVGVTFQHARLQLLRATVRAEVESLAGTTDADCVDDALRSVGLDPRRHGPARVAELSGGQQRRVLLAGLVARRCKVVVMDEPLAGLDHAGRTALTRVTDQLLDGGTAVVIVAHDPAWAADRADRVVTLATPAGVQRR